jgi:2-methylcitrate dehydratase PrpD
MPDINLQYILAVTLVDGSLSFEAAHSYARMKDPAVLDVKKRIAVVERPELRTAESSRTGVVEVTTTDGHRYREQVTAVRGTAQNPMRPAEVEKKCAALLRPIVGEARSSALIESVRTLERVTDVRTLGPSLSAR